MKRYLLAIALALAGTHATAETQGVGKTEITLGTIQDLSGPIAAYGKQARMGMQLRLEEANEQGGVHGRKLKLLVEDSAYDLVMDAFVRAATKAGPTLGTDSFVRAMDSLVVPPDIFGGPELSWSATKRLGSDASRLAQIRDGRWKVVSGYLNAP